MRDRGLVSMGHLWETTHCGCYGHVTGDVQLRAWQTMLTKCHKLVKFYKPRDDDASVSSSLDDSTTQIV